MALELYYTSAPRGLRRGVSGLCVVAATRGLPAAVSERLVALTAPHPGDAIPVFSHARLGSGAAGRTVLSRVAAAGLDHTRRPNKLAYHLVLEPNEQLAGGAAWAMRQRGVMAEAWSGDPREIDEPRRLTFPTPPTENRCDAWRRVCGDAGWAGVLAENFVVAPERPVNLLCPAEDALELIDEAARLLPLSFQWQVSFSTNYGKASGTHDALAWRCIRDRVASNSGAARGGSAGSPMLIDLLQPRKCPQSAGAAAARAGVRIEAAR